MSASTGPRLDDAASARKARHARVVTTIHARGVASLDGMLDLAERASRRGPLDETLAALAERIAALLGVEVCSIYLREPDSDELVLRATHGFPAESVGIVRMRVGEGLTGFAVECLRPVSVAAAVVDARNKRFAGLDEERFPALCALPLVDGGRGVGALVVQRREPRAFDDREIVLIAAMAPTVLFAVERARAEASHAQVAHGRQGGARPLEVLLRGVGVSPGRAVGRVAVRRAPVAPKVVRSTDSGAENAALERALAAACDELAALDAWARDRLDGPLAAQRDRSSSLRAAARGRLLATRFLLDDDRLRERMARQVAAGATAADAVERVVREYARNLGGMAEEALRDRAIELEALAARVVEKLHSATKDDPVDEPGRVLAASRLTVFEAVEFARAHGSACALSGPADASPGLDVARALGLAVVCDVKPLFRWVQEGDRLLVDGDAGTLVVNPSRADVAAHRRERVR